MKISRLRSAVLLHLLTASFMLGVTSATTTVATPVATSYATTAASAEQTTIAVDESQEGIDEQNASVIEKQTFVDESEALIEVEQTIADEIQTVATEKQGDEEETSVHEQQTVTEQVNDESTSTVTVQELDSVDTLKTESVDVQKPFTDDSETTDSFVTEVTTPDESEGSEFIVDLKVDLSNMPESQRSPEYILPNFRSGAVGTPTATFDNDDTDSDIANVEDSNQDTNSGGALSSENDGSSSVTKSDTVDYTGWTILKVEGFNSGTQVALKDGDDESTDDIDGLEQENTSAEDGNTPPTRSSNKETDIYPLAELEENPDVRVLQEHQQEGFFHIAVSPQGLQGIVEDLKSRGLTVQNFNRDLGKMIAESSSNTFRKVLPRGEVTFDSYMTLKQIEDYIMEFAARHPQVVTRSVIGRSVEGRNIHMLTLTLGGKRASRTDRSLHVDDQGSTPARPVVREAKNNRPYPAVGQTVDVLAGMIAFSHQKLVEEHMNRQLEMIKKQKEKEEQTLRETQQLLLNEDEAVENEPDHVTNAVNHSPVIATPSGNTRPVIITAQSLASANRVPINMNAQNRPVIITAATLASANEAPIKINAQNSETHAVLGNIIHNFPYDALNDETENSIKNTYMTLKDIIDVETFDSSEYVHLDYLDEPEAVKMTFKVLQRIINYDPQNPFQYNKNKADGSDQTIYNRIARLLNISDLITPNVNGSSETSISTALTKAEADISFLLETFIPENAFVNETVTKKIKEAIVKIDLLLPPIGSLTKDKIKAIASQIDIGITSSESESAKHFLIRLVHLLQKKTKISNPTSSSDSTPAPTAAPQTETAEVPVRLEKPVVKQRSGKPVIFIDGGIHAREWVSPAFLMYIMEQLVENTGLLLGAEWRIVPVLNPDGYLHTWTRDRLWRKNRAKSSGCPGVDLNRNFGYKFGGAGTSSRTCSQIYRGTKAFSEPESRALRGAIMEVKDRLQAYVSVHSYGQMILHPWGYTARSNHHQKPMLTSMGKGMAAAIKAVHGKTYVVGSAAKVLYAAAGGSDDWVSSVGVPYSYTMELRDKGTNGFVLPASEIRPTITESWAAIEYLGNRIIRESPRSEADLHQSTIDEQEEDSESTYNDLFQVAPAGYNPVLQSFAFYPNAPLVPLLPGFGSGAPIARPVFYPSPGSGAFQSGIYTPVQNFNSPNVDQFYTQGQQQQPIAIAILGEIGQNEVPNAGQSSFTGVPVVSIQDHDQANIKGPFIANSQSVVYNEPGPYLVPVSNPFVSVQPNFVHLSPFVPTVPSSETAFSGIPSQFFETEVDSNNDSGFNTGNHFLDYINTPFPTFLPYESPVGFIRQPSQAYPNYNQHSQYSVQNTGIHPFNYQSQYATQDQSPVVFSSQNFKLIPFSYLQPIQPFQFQAHPSSKFEHAIQHFPQQQQNIPPVLGPLGNVGTHQEYETEGRNFFLNPITRNGFHSLEPLQENFTPNVYF